VTVRFNGHSWGYDFQIQGYGRHRKTTFRTRAEAVAAERRKRAEVLAGHRRIMFADAYQMYLDASTIKDRSRDSYESYWPQIEPTLGHLYLEDVDTLAFDALKKALPDHLGKKSINNRLALARAVLHFCRKRKLIETVPFIPMESIPQKVPDWYSDAERDRFLAGCFELQPRWYLFFYLSGRLGLRLGEVYATSRSRLREIPPQLIVDRALQRGTKRRPAEIIDRKNEEAYALQLPRDVVEAIRWHVQRGYSGEEFLFSKTGNFPRYMDSHRRPMRAIQKAMGLREISHHAFGRHSVASQAVTSGHSLRMVQAQLGHRSRQSSEKYAHLASRAQLRLVESLTPSTPPHVKYASK